MGVLIKYGGFVLMVIVMTQLLGIGQLKIVDAASARVKRFVKTII